MLNRDNTWIKRDLFSCRFNTKKIKNPKIKEQLEEKINKLVKYSYVVLRILKSVLGFLQYLKWMT